MSGSEARALEKSSDVVIHAMQMTAWNGALPPPEMAKAYEELCKGTFERLLAQAEKEAEARRTLASRDHEAYNRSVNCGLVFAFCLTLSAFVGAVICACMGAEKAAIALVGVTLVNLASTFIGRKSSGK